MRSVFPFSLQPFFFSREFRSADVYLVTFEILVQVYVGLHENCPFCCPILTTTGMCVNFIENSISLYQQIRLTSGLVVFKLSPRDR
jgi:hypothetical protein